MKLFTQSKSPYEEWKGDDLRRKQLLSDVAKLIGKRIPNPMTLYMAPSSYRAVDADYILGPVFTGAYPLVAGGCATLIKTKKDQIYTNQPINYFVEAGDSGQGRFIELMKASAPEIHALPLPKHDDTGKWLASFQAADFVAYEVALEWKRRTDPDRIHPVRGSLKAILDQIDPVIGEYPESSLRDLVRSFPYLFPRRH